MVMGDLTTMIPGVCTPGCTREIIGASFTRVNSLAPRHVYFLLFLLVLVVMISRGDAPDPPIHWPNAGRGSTEHWEQTTDSRQRIADSDVPRETSKKQASILNPLVLPIYCIQTNYGLCTEIKYGTTRLQCPSCGQ
jgi:hypothetical protein